MIRKFKWNAIEMLHKVTQEIRTVMFCFHDVNLNENHWNSVQLSASMSIYHCKWFYLRNVMVLQRKWPVCAITLSGKNSMYLSEDSPMFWCK